MKQLSIDQKKQMKEVIENKETVSDKIRSLSSEGYSRSDISRFLGKRYQHVRNVLEGDLLKKK